MIISFLVVKAKLDLGFLILASGSVGLSNFKRCLQFIKNLVHIFIVSRQYTRFGAVLYNTRASKIFGLNRYNNKNQVLRAVSCIRYTWGGTIPGRALKYANRYLFRRRKIIWRITYLFTRGRFTLWAETLVAVAVAIHRQWNTRWFMPVLWLKKQLNCVP